MAAPSFQRAVHAVPNTRVVAHCERAEALMSDVLRAGRPLAPEYPLVFGEETPGRFVLVEEGDQVVSALAFLPREFRVGDEWIRVGLIGSVATHTEERGRGLASATLERAHAELAHEGCLFSLLWAEDPSFYEARGYRSIGFELDHFLPIGVEPDLPQPTGVRPIEAGDVDAVLALYHGHRTRVERSRHELELALAIPHVETLVQEQGGELRAYTCRGRGEDLRGVVHEWGGEVDGVLACLAGHREAERLQDVRGPGLPMVVLVPPQEIEHSRALTAAGLRPSPGVLGMGRLLNPDGARDLWARYGPGGEPPSEDRLLAALFGADEAAAILRGRACELPLLPFAWGFDSI